MNRAEYTRLESDLWDKYHDEERVLKDKFDMDIEEARSRRRIAMQELHSKFMSSPTPVLKEKEGAK